MTSAVTKAMIESYALMVMVMGTFFLYFCGMVWAFCNPKLSGAEEECRAHGDDRWICGAHPRERNVTRAGTQCSAEELTHTTYVNFWDDTDSLLSHCTGVCREDFGINNRSGGADD